MRTAKVILPFVDKQEGVFRNAGDTFPVSDERGEQLEKGGFVTLDPAERKPAAKKRTVAKK